MKKEKMENENSEAEAISINLKNAIDKIKTEAINSGERDEAVSVISFFGMIFDEISNLIKKGIMIDIEKTTDDLDPAVKKLIIELDSVKSKKIISEKLDELAVYCDKAFMELMSGVSCAVLRK